MVSFNQIMPLREMLMLLRLEPYYIYKMLILLKMVIVTFKMYQFCFVATCTDMKKFGKASLILFQKKQEEGEHLYISSLSAVIGP